MATDAAMFVAGEWTGAASGETFTADSPATGEAIAEVPQGDRDDAPGQQADGQRQEHGHDARHQDIPDAEGQLVGRGVTPHCLRGRRLGDDRGRRNARGKSARISFSASLSVPVFGSASPKTRR